MLSVLKGHEKLADLKTELGRRDTSILHALQDLISLNIIVKHGGAYKLTPLGIMETLILKEVSVAAEVLEMFKDFWLLHDTASIPTPLLPKIGALRDSTLIRSSATNLTKVHNLFSRVLLTSKRIKGVSPIFHSDYVEIVRQCLAEGASVEMILTSDILERVLASADSPLLSKYLEEERLRLFLDDDLRFGLTVTENSLSLGLFTLGGDYDYQMDLVSNSREAVEWGEELFQHCLKKAKRLDKEELFRSLQ